MVNVRQDFSLCQAVKKVPLSRQSMKSIMKCKERESTHEHRLNIIQNQFNEESSSVIKITSGFFVLPKKRVFCYVISCFG